MNTVQPISNTQLNQNSQHKQQEQQRLYNRINGHLTIFEMMLEKVLADGGKQNANS